MQSSSILIKSLNTEFKTVSAMVEIYCKAHHNTQGLCSECAALIAYAETKLDRCPYGDKKPTCNRCPIHCYKPDPKEQMRLVMRYSGPRMLLHHPLLAVRHLVHEKRPVPDHVPRNNSNRFKRRDNAPTNE
ncbi:nitrous oxide-stimulated promoter family protein [Vibrio tapetis subsp. quintayensis]|uniref:nitrous oxide-stimulated promoter family protein n=1 Tax=Vibrio tapetis TaxID=52443 RepID=UPI0025B4D9EC|nr:nitrous oxide-stimulated promoter family protein [Vibrio tapetis]MDN3680609.1 nitrous oxide-stimulated promoter family protein [Vibrio tapetis subsp. quintayensis]